MDAIEDLRSRTARASKTGDPHSLKEQFKFMHSHERVAFYWSENSFVLFFKPPMGGSAFQITRCDIKTGNERIKISMLPVRNKLSYLTYILVATTVFICFITGLIIEAAGLVIAIPIIFLVFSFVLFLIRRQNRKEVKWFLEDLVAKE